MLSHNQAKFIASLQVKKYRQKYRNFIVEGDKMVGELITQDRFGVSAIYGLESWASENARLLQRFPGKFNLVTDAELAKISTLSTPNKVLSVAEMPDTAPDYGLLKRHVCLYLDGLQDPGNVGTILRTADWFGIPAVFCSPDCADVFNPKVVQATMGAIFRVRSWELRLPDLLDIAPQTPVMGAVLGGEDIFQAKSLPDHGLLVIGNEGRGISAENTGLLTRQLSIPRPLEGKAESLNAAVAAGILAALIVRRF